LKPALIENNSSKSTELEDSGSFNLVKNILLKKNELEEDGLESIDENDVIEKPVPIRARVGDVLSVSTEELDASLANSKLADTLASVSLESSSDKPNAIDPTPKKDLERRTSFEKTSFSIAAYNDILCHDVFLIFKFLCNKSIYSDRLLTSLSTDTFNPNTTQSLASQPFLELSANATKSRILAMELLMSVFNNVGSIILNDKLFITLVKENITLSISKNAVTTNPALFELSLSILLLVMRHYRHHLKLEIEVLLVTIYLQILEMGNSTYTQRSIVLQALIKICGSPQVLSSINNRLL
jgi:hypothetical protein